MSRKLHRGRTRVFHKKNTAPLKAIGWVCAAAVIVAGGFFGAKFLLEKGPGADSSSPSSAGAASAPAPVQSQPSEPSQPDVVAPGGSLRAFYLPLSALKGDTLSQTLEAAAGGGFNAVFFDLKDSEGRLHYVSGTDLALQAESAAADAMPLEELKSLFLTIKSKGLAPIPRLYAFLDPLAPWKLSSAKITSAEHPTWTWYDGDPKAGGKPWLNPYAVSAQQYLTGLITELKAAGADTILLDGVQFPKQTKGAGFGNGEYASQTKAEVLATFISAAKQAVDGGRIVLAAPGLAALGTETTVFGGNPVTFGASVVAPVLMPSTLGDRLVAGSETVDDPAAHPYDAVKAAAAQIGLRLQVIDEAERPSLCPWLQAYEFSAADITEQIRAVTDALGADASYLLYNPGGSYDFAALR